MKTTNALLASILLVLVLIACELTGPSDKTRESRRGAWQKRSAEQSFATSSHNEATRRAERLEWLLENPPPPDYSP
jgi:hypothetical protein